MDRVTALFVCGFSICPAKTSLRQALTALSLCTPYSLVEVNCFCIAARSHKHLSCPGNQTLVTVTSNLSEDFSQ